MFLFHIFTIRGFLLLPKKRVLSLQVSILFKNLEKNVNKKPFLPTGKGFSVVCLLLMTVGIPAS
jgi:hypothetical protein